MVPPVPAQFDDAKREIPKYVTQHVIGADEDVRGLCPFRDCTDRVCSGGSGILACRAEQMMSIFNKDRARLR